jgi:hypothetical protein
VRVCQIYVGHRRTFWHTQKNHQENLKPIHWVHQRDENSSTFNYYRPGAELHLYHSRLEGDTNVYNVLNSWHNRYVAFSTAPEDYEVYVLMRYDTLVQGVIDFRDYTYSDDVIYVPVGNDHRMGVNDQLVFGNWRVMQKYVSINLNHSQMFHTTDPGLFPWFHNESYCTRNLELQGVQISRVGVTTDICYDRNHIPLHLQHKVVNKV